MDKWIEAFAKDIGAQVVAELPHSGFGPFDAAHAAGFYSRRMAELRRQDADHSSSHNVSLRVE